MEGEGTTGDKRPLLTYRHYEVPRCRLVTVPVLVFLQTNKSLIPHLRPLLSVAFKRMGRDTECNVCLATPPRRSALVPFHDAMIRYNTAIP